jgi:hypothetical protein
MKRCGWREVDDERSMERVGWREIDEESLYREKRD